MKNYDAIVIGSGCGALISDEAAGHGLKTALIDKGPLIGGTCLNWGCIPSKMREIGEALQREIVSGQYRPEKRQRLRIPVFRRPERKNSP